MLRGATQAAIAAILIVNSITPVWAYTLCQIARGSYLYQLHQMELGKLPRAMVAIMPHQKFAADSICVTDAADQQIGFSATASTTPGLEAFVASVPVNYGHNPRAAQSPPRPRRTSGH